MRARDWGGYGLRLEAKVGASAGAMFVPVTTMTSHGLHVFTC